MNIKKIFKQKNYRFFFKCNYFNYCGIINDFIYDYEQLSE